MKVNISTVRMKKEDLFVVVVVSQCPCFAADETAHRQAPKKNKKCKKELVSHRKIDIEDDPGRSSNKCPHLRDFDVEF